MFNTFQWTVCLRMCALIISMMVLAPACFSGHFGCGGDLYADVVKDIDAAPGYEDPKDIKRDWALSLGLGSSYSPDYEGSNDYKLSYGPHISASWRDLIFFKGKTLGANLIRHENFKGGPVLSWTGGRNEDDNEKLEGMGDVDPSVEAGVFVSYRNKPLRFNLEARQDIGSGHEGSLVELRVGAAIPVENPFVLVELGTTWASADYMESFFGVNARQSAASGLEKFHAGAGIKDFNIRVAGGHAISRRWRIGGTLEYKRLVGDAADSPVVSDKNQYFTGFELSYHLGAKAHMGNHQ